MASGVAWLSFDTEQQRRTQLMLAALSSQGTVDELGLGIIRDLIARALHPGLTVLHRRAKYLLLIPRDYQGLKPVSLEAMLAEGRRAEARTMERLTAYYRSAVEAGDDSGIIGRRQGELTQQLPSGMYWGLLRQLGILREPGSLSDYCRRRVEIARQQAARGTLHEEGDAGDGDHGAWTELPAGEFTGFNLSRDEAEWLRGRFLASEHRPASRRSLVSWLLDPSRGTWWTDVPRAWDHPDRASFPEQTAEALYLGRDLDLFIHSARITYNYLCAVGRPDHGERRDALVSKYEKAMRSWERNRASNLISAARLQELDRWAQQALTEAKAPSAARTRWSLTYRFFQDWQAILDTRNPLAKADAADLLCRRESWLKQGRARLRNPELLRGWSGDSGYFHLDYNWAVAMRICGDIHGQGGGDGLGTPHKSLARAG